MLLIRKRNCCRACESFDEAIHIMKWDSKAPVFTCSAKALGR
jgi:hypothetical protein